MKKYLAVIFLFSLTFGIVFSQPVTVIKPTEGDIWVRGHSYVIQWNLPSSVRSNVRITAIHPVTRAEIRVIANDAPNNKPFPLNIPNNAPVGKFRIRVQIKASGAYGDSGVFEVVERLEHKVPADIDKAIPRITVTYPKTTNKAFNKLEFIDIAWEINFRGGAFELDLYNHNGQKKMADIYVGYVEPIGRQYEKYRYRWQIPNLPAAPTWGYYKIRIKSGSVIGFSDKFPISMGLKKTTVTLNPQIINHEYLVKPADNECAFPGPEFSQQPGKCRVGWNYGGAQKADDYCNHFWKAYIYFGIESLKSKKQFLLSAKLLLQDRSTLSHPQNSSTSSLRDLMVMTGDVPPSLDYSFPGWIYNSFSTPASPSEDIEMDVLALVRDWLEGTAINYGLLIRDIGSPHSLRACISHFKAKLVLEFLEPEN